MTEPADAIAAREDLAELQRKRADALARKQGRSSHWKPAWQEKVPFTVEVHPDRDTWLEAGRALGSSDAPTVLGYGYHSPLELWGRLTGKIQPGAVAGAPERRLRRGKYLEPFIHREAEEELGTSLVHPGDFTVFRSKERPWMTATVDRFVTDADKPMTVPLLKRERTPASVLTYMVHSGRIAGPGELKSVGAFVQKDWLGEEPPPYPLIQVQHQLAVTGLPRGWVIALLDPGDELLVFEVQRHEALISALLEAEERFMELVRTDVPPRVDGSEQTHRALAALFPEAGGEAILGPEYVTLHRRLVEVKAEQKRLEGERGELEARLKLAIGNLTRVVIPQASDELDPILQRPRDVAYQWKTETRTYPPRLVPDVKSSRVLRCVKP